MTTSSSSPLHPDSSGETPTIVNPTNADQVDARLALKREIDGLNEQNRALADAVVNSAAIIEELEQTKLKLAEAQVAAEKAHLNTQLMAETIFEETRDAMIVLDKQLGMISANHNARKMFQIGHAIKGQKVMEVIEQQYRSEVHRDWLNALFTHAQQPRLELYKASLDSRKSKEIVKQWIQVSISPLQANLAEAKFLLTAQDISQRKQIDVQLKHQALHDNTTGLPNRRFFALKIEELLAADPQQKHPFSVCFLDLDNFKAVNDTLGHEAGDRLLVEVAQRIENTIRNDCFLARFGGDEFALMIFGLSTTQEEAICKRIVTELRKPFKLHDNSVYIGASIGKTRYPDDAQDVDSLMQNADVAMYSAKDSGRNRFHSFTPELAEKIKERQDLLADLRLALEQKEIALEYQPKWCLRTNQLAGCEALLRWKRNGILVPPCQLVAAAEVAGLILPLGQLIIEQAVQQAVIWNKSQLLNGRMAINLSPRQLSSRGFTSRVQKTIVDAGIEPDCIEFEITETAMIENFEEAFARIEELNEVGFTIAIDDFGTGYSSLSYLKSFPVSVLKIDRSLISDLPHDSKAVAVAKAVLSLGHGLGLEVIAEGVENESQRQFLLDAGCDYIQGFFLSKSLTPTEFENWVRATQK